MRTKSTHTTKQPLIALDGPSALSLYRDRDDAVQASVAYDVSRSANQLEDECYYLTDEDVAATLASTNIFGHSGTRRSPRDSDVWPDGLDLVRSHVTSLRRCCSRSSEIKLVPFGSLGLREPEPNSPLHLLVHDASALRRVKNVHQRVCPSPLPRGSIYKLGTAVLVPTPELTFLLLAQYLNLVDLIAVGMELCGHYRLVGANTSELLVSNRTKYDCDAHATPTSLLALLNRTKGFRGAKLARRAVKYMAPHSSSPMETTLYLLLCLPVNLGGYGLPAPLLNAKRSVNTYAESLTFSRCLIPDLYWPEARVDVEYDSDEFHASPTRLSAGARRTMALRTMHVEVVSVTRDIVYDELALGAVARLIALRLGRRVPKPGPEALLRRKELRSQLLF